MKKIVLLLLAAGMLPGTALHAGDNERFAIATPTTTPPQIDGRLEEAVWQTATTVNGFLQYEPFEGRPASEPTEIRILYDAQAIYFGCMMYDAEPDKIVARLTRRDNEIESDFISIRLDSFHDQKTAFEFTVLASGVKIDILQYNDGAEEDNSWDAIWEVKTQILHSHAPFAGNGRPAGGWSAEFKIPFNMLRYTPAAGGDNEWGFNVIRRISRKQETSFWALVRKSQNGFVSHFGHLRLHGRLPNPRHVELQPYAVAKGQFTSPALRPPGSNAADFRSAAGFDLKYGLTSNLTIDLTVNPDFGQVEADPAVLNLSTFETFYPEKRPFFIEGTQILRFTTFGGDFGPGLFYSRRIGRPLTGRNEAATILGAAKLTGKTSRGLSFGMLQAVTDEEQALISEPAASYSLVRLKQDLLDHSTVGMMATAVARAQRYPAFTGGVDWNLRFQQSRYVIDGFWAGSHTTQGESRRISGSAGKLRFGKDGGTHWLYALSGDFTTRHYNINDLGFFFRPNDYGTVLTLRYKEDQPGRLLRQWHLQSLGHLRWNFDGARLISETSLSAVAQWWNYWNTDLSVKYAFNNNDDRESRGRGLYHQPDYLMVEGGVATDPRRSLIASFAQNYLRDAGGHRQWRANLQIEVRPTTWAQISSELGFGRSRNRTAWVPNVPDSLFLQNPYALFGRRDTEEYNLTLRSNLTFTRDLTLQLYAQTFLAKGHFDNFARLVSPTTLVPEAYNGNHDFNNRSFHLNLVWRWEYRPGSTLYLVWTQARRGAHDDFYTPVGRDFRGTFSLPAENVVLVKMSYWLQP
ncbi:MAG: carbohydrate binding family 9 domain-containing protein [candidate division KSB1 bacterium]|nr:carbohydrate binding family 9 domain-containing protein [candidate division KSB1 bacterium]MDZ7288189.1 carbohydrate binding family 9 domain-containing protein [candidate division KSB1 bacterium]MDZ7300430.1 carbohydrate binding family 9 domain-containing protein [candidate division KSB1 bacterium]MDZ7309284.1 carbohydrate binding family 9 domain-containing protein [candidate division KSB1 bacterium]MDZ7351430.1 carbohydrate binding family 9 domain-containing protein [candidate division KSB1